MVMAVEPIVKALESISASKGAKGQRIILATPQGRVFNQAVAEELSGMDSVVIVCGRYEGVDERVREFVDMELSAGDYIMSGGEVLALGIVDAVGRLCPGVLGNEASRVEDSFSNGILEHPHYTRPEEFRGIKVPEVLLSGNHGMIKEWRRAEAVKRTMKRRPELLGGIKAGHRTEGDKI
jgi:tRNA (guanine37-N1)-methyltransferase